MKKFLNLIFLFAILMVGLISAGQYCPLEIRNKTPIDFNRTTFVQYQMVQWWCPEKIPKNSVVYCYMNPSSSIIIDHKKTNSKAFYEGTLPDKKYGDKYDRKYEFKIITQYFGDPYYEYGVYSEFLSEGTSFYKKSWKINYPNYSAFRTCLFLITLNMQQSKDLPLGRRIQDPFHPVYDVKMDQD